MKWTFRPLKDLGALAREWDELNEGSGGLPFLRSDFVIPLAEVFADQGEKIAICESEGAIAAMGILSRTRLGQWTTFQPSQLPLGAWLMRRGTNVESLLSGLAKRLPGFTAMIGLTQQDPELHPRPASNERIQTLDYIQTARVSIKGTFDEYWAARGRNLRHNIKRQHAKLAQDGIMPRLEVLTSADAVAGAIEDYGRLESAGWKASLGTAVHPDNAQGRFYRAMLERFCRAGSGTIYRYWFNDRVVAIDLCIRGGGSLVILKTTYDESIKNVSPAFLMREEAFKRLFESKEVERIEFFGKLMDWHTRWTDEVRTLYHLNFYRTGLLQKLRAAVAGLSGSGVLKRA